MLRFILEEKSEKQISPNDTKYYFPVTFVSFGLLSMFTTSTAVKLIKYEHR